MIEIGSVKIYNGDCREVARELEGVSAVVTDPPYGLSFMMKDWDHKVPGVDYWSAIRSACLPGAYVLAFGGTRTFHRQVVAIEDSGFDIRDCLMWVYGSGFPKSLDISKAIDKAAGAEREIVGEVTKARSTSGSSALPTLGGETVYKTWDITKPATPEAETWSGYGTALKPALEPITLAQNPRAGSFVDNVLSYGCGGLNVDGCRIEGEIPSVPQPKFGHNPESLNFASVGRAGYMSNNTQGRYPSNLLIDESFAELFPNSKSGSRAAGVRSSMGFNGAKGDGGPAIVGSSGSAARFFYCAKASRLEREAGLDNFEPRQRDDTRLEGNVGGDNPRNRGLSRVKNYHPTVKPLTLMRYLVRLVTQPERNLILDPFAGSGTTAVACALAGIPCVAIELDSGHCDIIEARVLWAVELRRRLGREPELDLTPYQKKTDRPTGDQVELFEM